MLYSIPERLQRQLPATLRFNIVGRNLQHARTELEKTPLGAPPVDYDVRSTFDVRPVAGFDFNIAARMPEGELVATTSVVVEMSVPEGLVAVLRKIDIWIEGETGPNTEKSDILWSLLLNGADFPYNADIPMGVQVDDETVYMLADEYNRVGVRVDAATAIFYGAGDAVAWVRFYGNFLLKTGRPLPFEIANPSRTRSDRPALHPRPAIAPPKEPQPIAPVVTAPAPVKEVAPVIERPPFPISWSAHKRMTLPDGTNVMLVPIQNDRGQRRELSREEILRYYPYLRSIWPGVDGRKL